jgi:hypothetical protein
MREVESRHKGRFLLGLVLALCAFAAMELAARGASTSTATLNACGRPTRVAAL